MAVDNEQEIIRLRDRVHDMASTLTALRYLVDDHTRWQKHFEPIIEDLREADRIADAVAKRMQEDRTNELTVDSIGLTKTQRRAAIGGVAVATLAAVADVALRLVSLIH